MAKTPLQLTTRHQFVQAAKPKTTAAKAGTAIVQAVDALAGRHDGAALRDALLDFFSVREAQFKPAELEAFFSHLIRVLPRTVAFHPVFTPLVLLSVHAAVLWMAARLFLRLGASLRASMERLA